MLLSFFLNQLSLCELCFTGEHALMPLGPTRIVARRFYEPVGYPRIDYLIVCSRTILRGFRGTYPLF